MRGLENTTNLITFHQNPLFVLSNFEMTDIILMNEKRLNNLTISLSFFENFSYGLAGGISSQNSFIRLNDVKIIRNTAEGVGGGIYCSYSDSSILNLSKVTIKNNLATDCEYFQALCGGIAIGSHTRINFDSINRCNIYNNVARC